ncbi:hypothetical protein ACPZ19_04895 [Amycolatopsis lurida]
MAPARPPPSPDHDARHRQGNGWPDEWPPGQCEFPQRRDDSAYCGTGIAQVVLQR